MLRKVFFKYYFVNKKLILKLLTDSVLINYLKKKYNVDKLMRVLYLITLAMCMEEFPKDTTHSTVRITSFNSHKQTTGICCGTHGNRTRL